jgi:hypothetical protein
MMIVVVIKTFDFTLIRRLTMINSHLLVSIASIIRTLNHIIECGTNYSAEGLLLEAVIDCED